MADDKTRLAQIAADLTAMGFDGLGGVTTAATAAEDTALDDTQRLQKMVTAYQGMINISSRMLEVELGKVEKVIATRAADAPDRGTLEDIAFSFREQQGGLEALRAFLTTGDRARLNEAREKLQRGAATARRAAQR